MSNPERANSGLAFFTYDGTLTTDVSMVEQQKQDLSGNTSIQTFCNDAFSLAIGQDISAALFTDSDVSNTAINTMVYIGSKVLTEQQAFMSDSLQATLAQNIASNAYNMTLGKNNKIPILSYLESLASEEKTFLFIGTKRQATTLIAQEAKRCNSYYVNHRWLGGMLTNWTTVKQRIERLKDLEKQEADGTFDLLTKKEVALRRKELIKLRKHLEGIKTMKELPDVAIIIDQKREMTAIAECRKLGIPVVSILDTNCDPDLVDIPIPGNDDAVRSIKLILNSLTNSIIQGQLKSTKG